MSSTAADLLGVPVSGPIPLMAAAAAGLPVAALDRLVESVAPSDNKFALRIVPRATLARRRTDRNGRLSTEESTRLIRLAAVWGMALDVWGDEEEARRFLFAEHPLLQGRRPVDVVLESELGRPAVEDILGRLQYGSAV